MAVPRARLVRRLVLILAATLLVALAAWSLRPRPLPVESAIASTGPLVVTVDEDGETRVRDRYVVSAPVAGRVLRIGLEPGEPVRAGAVVATLQPAPASLLDERTRAELGARLGAAQAAVRAAGAEEARMRVQVEQADRELARVRRLLAAGAVSGERAEAVEVAAATARQAMAVARERVVGAEADLRQVRAALAPANAAAARAIEVRAPVDGLVLRRLRESESVVPQGEPLLEIGNVTQLEVVADFLSTDAVHIAAGQRALIEGWGGATPLQGRVRRVEPGGFTKVSALGVEEQRVNVVVSLDPLPAGVVLGDHYRVDVRVIVWEAPRVVTVPVGCLVREGDGWIVFVIRDGRARRTPVTIGHRNGVAAEVVSGLAPGTRVIAFPGAGVADDVRVE
ncbi:membrane protein [Luteitalea sp. TBR-22]|uniref:efflux RND transporter periplasmic adaptor subunit n=1 Tax=Luteitalea sp. TBR-22 TaxID=2802971 RepID=UPI001AF75EFA|nr:HlyD family efflux transporter periplasmic adaptor subunit [Luteitalea sp. TBR-22]BCS34789.1 membrane protein [Luteitalea sp. TBR-22]